VETFVIEQQELLNTLNEKNFYQLNLYSTNQTKPKFGIEEGVDFESGVFKILCLIVRLN